jgi:hypothetical protein
MTESPHDQERRKHPRIKASIPIEFKAQGAAVASHAETADLSLSGFYVEMSFTLPVGTELDLVLWVEDERLPAKGIVVTHHPQFGNGVKFVEMSQESQAKLSHFLKSRETPSEEKPEASASG